MHRLAFDIVHAARRLFWAPGFTVPVVVLLSVGIGANAVFFHALDVLLFRPLPVAHADRLVRLVTHQPAIGVRSSFPIAVYEALRDHAASAEVVMARYTDMLPFEAEGQTARAVRSDFVSPNFYSELGVAAAFGHVPAAPDGDVVVLSYRFWQEAFAGDRSAIGRKVRLQGHPFVVAGVMPPGFAGWTNDTTAALWLPLAAMRIIPDYKPSQWEVEVVARLRPGVSRERAESEFVSIRQAAIETAVEPEWRNQERGVRPYLESITNGVSWLRPQVAPALVVLIASSAVVWLLVCANVAGLILGRWAARHSEFAVRLAIGASRSQLILLPLSESLVLTVLGGVGALLIAFLLTPVLVGGIPPVRWFDGRLQEIVIPATPDLRVLAFSLATCLATMLLSGLAPAWRSTRVDLHPALKAARATAQGRSRRALVVFQVALCMLLLCGAGLAVRTMRHFERLDAGFDTDHVVTFTAEPGLQRYSDQQNASLQSRLLDQVRRLPGVTRAALSSRGVMRSYGFKMTLLPAGRRVTQADFMNSSSNAVTPDYFDAMGMHLLAGRTFAPADTTAAKGPIPAIVNETLAQSRFPAGGALGRTIGTASPGNLADSHFVIIGIVSDARYRSLREPVQPTVFGPLRPDAWAFVLNVGTQGRPEMLIEPVLRIFRTLDDRLPVTEVHTLAEEVRTSLWREKLLAGLTTAFGIVALILAAAGIYALLSHSVVERSREIAVRMALGANAADVVGWTARQTLGLAVGGIVLGLAAALMALPAAARFLGDANPLDPVVIVRSEVQTCDF